MFELVQLGGINVNPEELTKRQNRAVLTLFVYLMKGQEEIAKTIEEVGDHSMIVAQGESARDGVKRWQRVKRDIDSQLRDLNKLFNSE